MRMTSSNSLNTPNQIHYVDRWSSYIRRTNFPAGFFLISSTMSTMALGYCCKFFVGRKLSGIWAPPKDSGITNSAAMEQNAMSMYDSWFPVRYFLPSASRAEMIFIISRIRRLLLSYASLLFSLKCFTMICLHSGNNNRRSSRWYIGSDLYCNCPLAQGKRNVTEFFTTWKSEFFPFFFSV